MSDDERGWTTFASNVGKARILHREAVEVRLRWLGAMLMLLAVLAGGFLALRYYGLRQGWWSTLLPMHEVSAAFGGAWHSISNLFARLLREAARLIGHTASVPHPFPRFSLCLRAPSISAPFAEMGGNANPAHPLGSPPSAGNRNG